VDNNSLKHVRIRAKDSAPTLYRDKGPSKKDVRTKSRKIDPLVRADTQ